MYNKNCIIKCVKFIFFPPTHYSDLLFDVYWYLCIYLYTYLLVFFNLCIFLIYCMYVCIYMYVQYLTKVSTPLTFQQSF